MTIQRRILIGQITVAGLLLVPAIYAVMGLGEVARRTRISLQSGLDRLYELDHLRSELERAVRLKGLSSALGDPEVQQSAQMCVENLEASYFLFRGRLAPEEAKKFQHMEIWLERTRSQGPEATLAPPWSPDEIEAARRDLVGAYNRAGRAMLDDTIEAEKQAAKAMRVGFLAFVLSIPLAIGTSVLAVRSLRKALRRLMSATLAVSAGKFGISVPVTGDDEMSKLTDAFNKMSENLATFEAMTADFLSVAAHELRSPLTCIKGYVGALREGLPEEVLENADVARYLERIDREADLMASKVSELLTFGMIEAGQLRLEPREIMAEGFLVMIGEAFKPIASERRIDFTVSIEGVPKSFVGDPDRLNQVVLNLLDNAFKYTPPGGRVALKGRGDAVALEIEVSDNGPGIPADQLSVIFEKYARVKTNSSQGQAGTGLGLAVAHGIVTAHRGTIIVKSEPGQGSSFTVRLPQKAETLPGRIEDVA